MSELARQIRAQIEEKTAQRNALTKEILSLEHDLGLLQEATKRERRRKQHYAWLVENDTENVLRYALLMQAEPNVVVRLLLDRDVPVRTVLKTVAFVMRTAGEFGDRNATLARVHNSREVMDLVHANLPLIDGLMSEIDAMVKGVKV